MQSVTLRSHVGADGLLKLQIPVELREVDVEVVVVMQPMNRNGATPAEKRGWPPGFLDQVIGGWQGDAPVIEYEGDYEVREELP